MMRLSSSARSSTATQIADGGPRSVASQRLSPLSAAARGVGGPQELVAAAVSNCTTTLWLTTTPLRGVLAISGSGGACPPRSP